MPHYIRVPVCNMHRFPDEHTEAISQAIYSEEVSLLSREGDFCLIQTDEGYIGWTSASSLIERPALTSYYTLGSSFNHLYKVPDTTPHKPLSTLPFMSKIEMDGPYHQERWLKGFLIDGTPCWLQQGDLWKNPALLSDESIFELGRSFLGLPYTWGGKSSFGYDCSGLIQTLFRFKNILLPRDSKDQAQDPRFKTIQDTDVRPGDLIFFGENIFHVGLVIDQKQFLHATVARMSTKTIIHTLDEIFDTPVFKHRLAKRLL